MYTSDRRLLLTENDEVVEGGDPRGVKLLVAEGGQLSDEDAAKHGLSGGETSNKEEDRGRPKEIKIGSGETSTAEAITDEEEIKLGEGDEPEDADAKKSSKKASKKSAKKR